MITIKVLLDNGGYLITEFKGTEEEAKLHFIGQVFNFGAVNDYIVTALSVEKIPNKPF